MIQHDDTQWVHIICALLSNYFELTDPHTMKFKQIKPTPKSNKNKTVLYSYSVTSVSIEKENCLNAASAKQSHMPTVLLKTTGNFSKKLPSSALHVG